MKIKYEINPAYRSLREEILAVPGRFEREGEVIYDCRNIIKVMSLGSLRVNVKSFKPPHILNRYVYAWLRKSKAERSFRVALRLLEKDILTPDPIAYIVYREKMGITRSYYISVQQECDYVLKDMLIQRPPDVLDLFRQYVRYVYELQRKGVFFVDLNVGNTLICRNGGAPLFYLVDLNRTKFKKVSHREGMANFCRIDLWEPDLQFLIEEYCGLTGEKPKVMAAIIERYKQKRLLAKKVMNALFGKEGR